MKWFPIALLILSMMGCAVQKQSAGPTAAQLQMQMQLQIEQQRQVNAARWNQAMAGLNKIATANQTLRQAVLLFHGVHFPEGTGYSVTMMAIDRIAAIEKSASELLNTETLNWNPEINSQINVSCDAILESVKQIQDEGFIDVQNAGSLSTLGAVISDISNGAHFVKGI